MSRTTYYKTEENSEEVEVTDVTEEIEEEIEELSTEPVSEPIVGIVTDCKKLRVRNYPELEANIICEIEVNSKVMIDENESTEEFYKVCTETGIDGYCMKRFIKVES